MNNKIRDILILFLLILSYQTVYSQDSLNNNDIYSSRVRVSKQDPDNFDIKLFRRINNNRSDFLNTSLTITDYSVLPVGLILPISMFTYGRAKNHTYDENSGVLMAVSEATSITFTTGIKYIFKRPRPYKTLSDVYLRKGILGDPYSFPSGHTSIAFTIATSLALRYPKYPQVYVPAYIWGIIVGYGRVYFGMHYPTDVLGGAVLGSLSAIGVYSLRNEIFKLKNKVLGEENKPDVNNYNSKTISIISVSFISAIIANEFLSSDKLGIYPSVNSSKDFDCSIRLKF